MKLKWNAWLSKLAYWTVIDRDTNCYIMFSKSSKDRNFVHQDIGYANPLGHIYHNMSFTDFRLARALIKYINDKEQKERFIIEYSR